MRLFSFLPILAGTVALAWQLGAQVRDPNATVNFPAVPGTFGYSFDPAFPGVVFNNPVAIVSPPGETNRLFVVEQAGRISVITNLAAPNRTTFLDLQNDTIFGGEQGLLGLTFHPRFAENGRFFVFRTVTASTSGAANQRHDRLSEFHVPPASPNRADPAEKVLLQQYDQAENHNGGDLHFGPDGYLYVSLGDEGGANDGFQNGQKIDKDFFGAILRLDVDARPDSIAPNPHPANAGFPGNYSVPHDNPYFGVTLFNTRAVDPTKLRTEFWSVGWRNPWRMSFDPATGELWVGNVGQDAWESVAVTRAGANHGWSYIEGEAPGPYTAPAGFKTDPKVGFVPPVYTYGHGTGAFKGNSVTGGLVYRGARFANLVGAYVFADYVDGNVWALRRIPGGPAQVERLGSQANVSAFGTDPRNGDVLLAHLTGNRLMRLNFSPTFTGSPLPATLAETGAFTDVAGLQPIPALVPYQVNLPFWSDGALKTRWFFVPGTNRLGFTEQGAWESPVGTVWMKHFEMEMTVGNPDSRRRLETRFIVRGSNGVYGVTYRWTSPSQAELVPDAGADETLQISDGGVIRDRQWHYPGRGECLTCHTPAAGGSLSFDTRQLNRTDPVTGTRQIARLIAAGYVANPPESVHTLPAHVTGPAPDGTPVSLEARARSYLAVNCSPCHRPGGTAPSFWDARAETPTDLTGIILGRLNDSRGEPDDRVVTPGDPAHSELLDRMSVRGATQMPPLATFITDDTGVQWVHDWVLALTNRVGFADWARVHLGDLSGNPPADRDSDGDGAVDLLEYLTGTDPRDPTQFWRPHVELAPAGDAVRLRFTQPAGVAFRVEMTVDPIAPWAAWEDPANAPFFPATPRDVSLELPATGTARFFRIRLTGL